MKKQKLIIVLILGFDILLASNQDVSPPREEDILLSIERDISLKVETILSTAKAKALFFAIEQGCDNTLISKFLDKVLQDYPKQEDKQVQSIIIQRAEDYFREHSVHVLELKKKINCSATRVEQRIILQSQLKQLLATAQLQEEQPYKKSKK